MFLLITHMITMEYRNLWIRMDNALRTFHNMDAALFVVPKGLSIFSEEGGFEYSCHGGKAVSTSQLMLFVQNIW